MPDEIRKGTIIYLLRQLGEKQIGKISIQKLVYFLQAFGIDLSYKYEMYHYGPYCFELSNDLDLLSMMNIISIEDSPTTYGYSIKLGDSVDDKPNPVAQQFLSSHESCFKSMLAVLGSCSARELELYATMHFVERILKERGRDFSAGAVIYEVEFLKPKYSKDELRAAYQYLLENSIVGVQAV